MRHIVLVILLLATPALIGSAGSLAPETCRVEAGIGLACPVEGGWEVAFADGSRAFTHGPDPVPSEVSTAAALAPLRDPPCVDDPEREYHSHLIYAHPIDKPDRSAALEGPLRNLVREANGLLWREGNEFGAPVEYRFRCEESGDLTMSVATIPVVTGAGDYTTLVNALRAMGFVNGHAKYWVWYDDPSACPCGGIAIAPLDPDRSPANSANVGGHFGATYGYMSPRILMHENGHNLGAVADSAPDSSGAAHCNDGYDIMCYSDGGPTSRYTTSACRDRSHFDCDHDTYFHPDPPAGTYLANRWQIGAPLNRFVQGCLYAEGDILAPVAPLDTARVDLPAECAGHRYGIYGRPIAEPAHPITGGPALRVAVNVFSLCWFDGDVLLECPSQKPWGHEGRVPHDATHAIVRWEQGEDARYTLSVI